MANNINKPNGTNGSRIDKVKKGVNKLSSMDKNLSLGKLVDYIGIFFIGLSVLLFLYYLKSLISKLFFSFKNIGSDFKQGSLYKYTRSGSDLGLKRNDYLDFDFVIRTDDASADCEISGRYTKDGLEFVEADGIGDLCNNLNYEK
jgi:hypothetical protein